MGELTETSGRVLEEARRVRDDNRAGGRHRRAGSIGAGSAKLKACLLYTSPSPRD